MEAERAQGLVPPGELRPAQLGIVLVGHAVFGHVSATLVDLAERGLLGVEELSGTGGEPDWLLTDLRDRAAGRRPLLDFESTLLNGLFAGQSAARLSEVSQALVPSLNRVRAQLRRDAVRHGRLSRWHRDRRTAHGEQLLMRIHVFRRELRALAASREPDGLPADLVPYAMIFGLRATPAVGVGAGAASTVQRRDPDLGWSRSDRFVQSWQTACAGFSAQLGRGHSHSSGTDRPGNFIQHWSNPRDFSVPTIGHGTDHDGYGGYGHVGGGHDAHGGGFGGGHGGH